MFTSSLSQTTSEHLVAILVPVFFEEVIFSRIFSFFVVPHDCALLLFLLTLLHSPLKNLVFYKSVLNTLLLCHCFSIFHPNICHLCLCYYMISKTHCSLELCHARTTNLCFLVSKMTMYICACQNIFSMKIVWMILNIYFFILLALILSQAFIRFKSPTFLNSNFVLIAL